MLVAKILTQKINLVKKAVFPSTLNVFLLYFSPLLALTPKTVINLFFIGQLVLFY